MEPEIIQTDGILTSELKALIAKADSVCFDFIPDPDAQHNYERDCRLVVIRLGIKVIGEPESIIYRRFGPYPARVATGYADMTETVKRGFGSPYKKYSDEAANWFRPTNGTVAFISSRFDHNLQSVFRSVRAGSKLEFLMALDNGTSQICIESQIHVDIFTMTVKPKVTRSGTQRPRPLTFELERAVCKHNTARFGNPGLR